MTKTRIIILLVLYTLFAVASISIYARFFQSIPYPYMSDIFKNSYYDSHRDHNQYLDAISYLKEKLWIDESPKILILIDYHSDVYRNNAHKDNSYEGIRNWVNILLSQSSNDGTGFIKEMYWVLPDDTKNQNEISFFWDDSEENSVQLRNGPKDQTIYVDDTTQRTFFSPKNTSTLRPVQIHKVLLKDLPSFENTSSQILLSIDYEHFVFDGKGTPYPVDKNPSNTRIRQKLTTLANALHDKHIYPVFTGCSQSPNYIFTKNIHVLDDFCHQIQKYSKTKSDILDTYAHTETTPPPGYMNPEMGTETPNP